MVVLSSSCYNCDWLMLDFRVLPYEQLDQGMKQGFAPFFNSVSEFKETNIKRESFFL